MENIKFNLNKIDDDELTKLLNLTALNGLEKRYPHEISGGEKQEIIKYCTPLIRKPDLLLLDEPFSN